MKKIGLSVYYLKVFNKSDKKYLDINDIHDNKSFIDILELFLDEMKGKYDRDKTSENIFTAVRIDKEEETDGNGRPDYNCIFGQIKTGE